VLPLLKIPQQDLKKYIIMVFDVLHGSDH